MAKDPFKGASSGPNGTSGSDGLVREGMLDRLLRRLVRPRVEKPLERVQLTSSGDMDLRWAPGRVNYAFYNKTLDRLEVSVNGGRLWVPTGAPRDLVDTTVLRTGPAANITYWIGVSRYTGTVYSSPISPGSGDLQLAEITTTAAWPASTTLKGFVAEYNDLHGITSRTTGDCWVTLVDRTTYLWTGTAWQVLLQVTDRRPNLFGPWGQGSENHVPLFMDGTGYTIPPATTDAALFQSRFDFNPGIWDTYRVNWWFEALCALDPAAAATDKLTIRLRNFSAAPTNIHSVQSPAPGAALTISRTSSVVTMPAGQSNLGISVTNPSPTYNGFLYVARLIAIYPG